jgi:NAD(P)-dependent dehydrogenase (short-subunit alcohol dehydrogenase family)
MEEAGAQLEHIDLLVNSAGIYREGPFVETSNEVIDDLFDINVKALIYTIQAALAWMQPGSCIINVASMSGVRPLHNNQTMYAATKAAVIQLGACLARELVPRRIRVNTISPGPTRTPIIETVAPKERIPEIEAYLAQVVPLGRLGEPGEVADAIAHLSTMEFATGANLVLDGGVVL